MKNILDYLKETIKDEYFSKGEKHKLKALLADHNPDDHQLNVLRSKIYELANQNVRDDNYKFIIEWIQGVNSAFVSPSPKGSDAFFSPGETCRNVIIKQISSAISRVQICVFTISDDTITDAILTTHRKGVEIKIITDNDKSEDEGSDIARFAKLGIPVKMDTTPNHMHHKFMVTDERTLITGSYNWTRSAARYNHENILLTQDGGAVKSYLKEFEQLWKVMKPYSG